MERGGRVADYVLHLTQEENVVLGADTVRRLIESQNGDAALLYLCIALRSAGVCQSKPRQELSKPHGGYIFLSNFEFSIVVRLVRCYNMQG